MKTITIELSDIPFRKQSHTPVLTHCRRLLKQGVDPNTRLEVTRNGQVDIIVTSIGEGAKWTVAEEPNCRFVKYAEPKFK